MSGSSKPITNVAIAKGHEVYTCVWFWAPPIVMNVKKIRRLMDKYGLVCPIRKANPYRRMAKALKTSNVAENLLKRGFTEYGPRRVLLTDISYIPYYGRFGYLSRFWMDIQDRYCHMC